MSEQRIFAPLWLQEFATKHCIFPYAEGKEQPIFFRFTPGTERQIKRNPVGAIVFAAQAIEKRETIIAYAEHLPVSNELRKKIRGLLLHQYCAGFYSLYY